MKTSQLAARALLYRLLASAYLYPEPEIEETICSNEFADTLRTAATALGNDTLVECIDALMTAASASMRASVGMRAEHVALFTRNVPCSPYGSRYLVRDVMSRPRVLEEVTRYYSAFGVQVDRDHPDLPDHIGTELEFVGYLLGKELHALETGEETGALICREARGRFLSEHLLLWFPAFRERLHEHARLPWYPALADAVQALLEDDARSLHVTFAGASAIRNDAETGSVSGVSEGEEHESSFDCGPISG